MVSRYPGGGIHQAINGVHVLTEEEKKRLLARLKKSEGQVRGVMRMVEEDKYCVDVMNQVAAIQGALAEVSKHLLSRHLDTCVRNAMESGKAKDRSRVLDELQDLFARYGRTEKPKARCGFRKGWRPDSGKSGGLIEAA